MSRISPNTSEDVLHLFSSDYRALYLQDCLDLLALPVGGVHRFRYAINWVWTGEGEPDQTRQRWLALTKKKTKVIVYFVANRSQRYGNSVLIPLRAGEVVRTFVEGDFLFVDFEVGAYTDPVKFQASAGLPQFTAELFEAAKGDHSSRRSAAAIAETTNIASLLGFRYPGGSFKAELPREAIVSAVLGGAPFSDGTSDVRLDQTSAFERVVTLIDELVGRREDGTAGEEFTTKRSYFRVLGIVERSRKGPGIVPNKGVFSIRSGKIYELKTFHIAFGASPTQTAKLDGPDWLKLLRDEDPVVQARYDARDFPFFALPREASSLGELLINGATVGAAQMPDRELEPRVRLLVRALPRLSFSTMGWMIAIGSIVTAFALALASMRALIVIPPTDGTPVLDISWLAQLLVSEGYLAIVSTAVLPASVVALGAAAAAIGAIFRRRWGLSTSA